MNANRKRAEDALRQAKATKSYEEFGLLAEKISEDDFRVNMGDHKAVGRDKLPPQVVKAALAMQAGQVSGLIQIENAFTIFRLNAHNPPTKAEPGSKSKLTCERSCRRASTNSCARILRSSLRAKAKIEIV